MPSQVKNNATGDHRCFKLHKNDESHFRVLRAISSGKAQGIFQTKSYEESKLYTWMSILYNGHVLGNSMYVTRKYRRHDKILFNNP